MIAVDTNVIAYFFLGGEKTRQARQAFRLDPHWVAPLLWRSEFQSVLSLYLRKKRLTIEVAQRFMEMAETLFQGNEYRVNSTDVLNLVAKSTCSAYDCEFVALARELKIRLITTDREILKEFSSAAISLDQFAAQTS